MLAADWGWVTIDNDYDEEDVENVVLLKYAARDAFLTYQIAIRCIEKSGLPPE